MKNANEEKPKAKIFPRKVTLKKLKESLGKLCGSLAVRLALFFFHLSTQTYSIRVGHFFLQLVSLL